MSADIQFALGIDKAVIHYWFVMIFNEYLVHTSHVFNNHINISHMIVSLVLTVKDGKAWVQCIRRAQSYGYYRCYGCDLMTSSMLSLAVVITCV